MSREKYPTTTPDWRAAVKRRTQFYLLMAFLLAILFGILVFQFFSRQQASFPGKLITAVFASQDINEGAVISREMVEVREVPARAVPASYLIVPEQVVGQVALYPYIKGEVILPSKLAVGEGGLAAQRCPSGKWCVRVPEGWFITAPADLAEGDRVEIASSLPGGKPDQTGYIAADVQVVMIAEDGEAPAYVFALDDREALSLLYARSNQFQLLALLRPAGGD